MNFDLTFKYRRIDFVVYLRILKCFRGFAIGCFRRVQQFKAQAKAESSGLCQSCTAEGVLVSVAEGKKNIYGYQQ